MMMTLFDYEQIMKNHDATLIRNEQEKAIITLVQTYIELNGTKENAIPPTILSCSRYCFPYEPYNFFGCSIDTYTILFPYCFCKYFLNADALSII